MGSSSSKNISNAVTKAIAKVSSNIIQNTRLSQDQSQVISVKNVDGDVVISGNRFTQKAVINMKSLLDALSKEESQQKILLELTQEAKSLTSGLNLGQYSNAQNIMSELIEGTVNLLTTINQICNVFSNQFQQITVDRVSGHVYIKNNVFSQIQQILQNCTEKAVSDSKIIQDLQSKLSQTSSATSAGLSLDFLIIIAGIIIGAIVTIPIAGFVLFFKFLFPILLIIGVALLYFYFNDTFSSEELKLKAYSKLIKNTPICNSKRLPMSDNLINTFNAIDAYNICLKDAQCQAFDWQGMNVNNDNGTFEIITPPNTYYYSGIASDCIKNIGLDNTILVRTPTLFEGLGPPNNVENSQQNDVYLDKTDSMWYKKNVTWESMGRLTNTAFTNITWGYVNPEQTNMQGSENNVYIFTELQNPLYFYVYRYFDNVWNLEQKIRGPGLVPAVSSIINTSGYKVINKSKWMLYTGIGFVVIGLVGSFFIYTRKSSMDSTKKEKIIKKIPESLKKGIVRNKKKSPVIRKQSPKRKNSPRFKKNPKS